MYMWYDFFAIQKFLCYLYFVYNYAQNPLVYLVYWIMNGQNMKYLGTPARVAHNLFCLYLKLVILLYLVLNPSN